LKREWQGWNTSRTPGKPRKEREAKAGGEVGVTKRGSGESRRGGSAGSFPLPQRDNSSKKGNGSPFAQ